MVVVEGAPLVLVATVAVDQDVATHRVFVLCALAVSAEHAKASEITNLGPWISVSQPDGGGQWRGIASRPWWGVWSSQGQGDSALTDSTMSSSTGTSALEGDKTNQQTAPGSAGVIARGVVLVEGGILPWFDRTGDKAPIEDGMRASTRAGDSNWARAATQWRRQKRDTETQARSRSEAEGWPGEGIRVGGWSRIAGEAKLAGRHSKRCGAVRCGASTGGCVVRVGCERECCGCQPVTSAACAAVQPCSGVGCQKEGKKRGHPR